MKAELITPSSGKRISADEAIELQVLVTDSDGTPAAGAKLIWLTSGRRGKLKQRTSTTDRWGKARNRLSTKGKAGEDAAPIGITVQTPDGETHVLGMLHDSTIPGAAEGVSIFFPRRNPLAPGKSHAAIDALDSSGTLSIVYPPNSLQLPVMSPVEVWAYYSNNGVGLGNQPISFTPGAYTTVTSADAQTDADGFAHAVVLLNKPGNVGGSYTYDGSVAVAITNAQASVNWPLHANTNAGGPGGITSVFYDFYAGKNIVYRNLWNVIIGKHTSPAGGGFSYSPVTFNVQDLFNGTSVYKGQQVADGLGRAWNLLKTNLPTSATALPPIIISAPNALAGQPDTGTFTFSGQLNIVDLPGGLGTGSIDVGPTPDHSVETLPIDTPITFTANFNKSGNGGAWGNKPLTWTVYGDPYPYSSIYIESNTTTTNDSGVATNTIQVGTSRNRSAPLVVIVTGYEGDGKTLAVQGVWNGQFYDVNDPPFSHEQVDVTPPPGELAVGTGYTFQAQVLTGFDPVRGEANTPAPGQTVHWYADDASKARIVFSQPGGPIGTVAGERFPTATGPDGKTSVQVSALGTDVLTATVFAETSSLDGNTYTGKAIVPFGEKQACTINIQGPTSAPLYQQQTLTAQIQGQGCGISAIDWSVNQGSDQTHAFQFVPPRSDVAGGSATTQIMGYGQNSDVPVTVYARPAEPVAGIDPGTIDLTFKQSQVPSGTVRDIVSLEGDPLSTEPVYHLVQATYVNFDGTKATTSGWDGTITWQAYSAGKALTASSSLAWLTTDPTPTDDKGVATNGIMSQTESTFTLRFRPTGALEPWSNWLEVTFQDDADLPGQGTINVRSDDTLTLGKRTPVYADYTRPSGVPDNTVVRWQAFPADRLTFDSPISTTVNGTATNYVTGSGTSEIDIAFIHAASLNPTTGSEDHGQHQVTFEQSPDVINIVPEPGEMKLYTAHAIDGSYTGDKPISQVWWSVDPTDNPGYTVTFDQNPSDLTGNQGAKTTTTQMTVFGPNEDATIRVYANSMDPNNSVSGVTDPPLEFSHVTALPQTRQLNLDSLDGNPLKIGEWHVVQATYVQAGGTAVANAPLTWTPPSGMNLLTDSGETGPDGIMTNAVKATTNLNNVTLTVSADGTNDTGSLKLTFQSSVKLDGQGTMTITPVTGPLPIGAAQPLSVTYTNSNGDPVQDTDVTWIGFPSDRLTFGDGSAGSNVSTTNSSGVATINVTASDGPRIPTAVIATMAFNDAIGAYDHSDPDLTVAFQNAPPTTGVVGIEIDKAYAKNPKYGHGIVWTDPSMAIKCQLQVLGASGSQTVLLPTDQEQPDRRTVEMVDATGKALVRDSLTGYYQLTTNGSDPTAFFVGSPNPTRLSIGTQWNGKPQPASAMLTLATNVKTAGDTMPAPTIQELQGKVLQIPGSCPAPTFKVNIPKASGVQDGDYVALLLNDRLVYHGLAAPALLQSQGVDVAYAALKLSGTNNLVYVAFEDADDIWGKSLPCSFTVDTSKGQPQTGPCPTVSRDSSLKPATVDASSPIGASDIVPSLDIYIAPYSGMDVNDVITAFFYLQGTDVLTQETGGGNITVYNIVPVTNLNPVVVGETVKLSLPQWAAAGYANVNNSGQLQVDYQVAGKTTRWSQTLLQALTLNTTIPFASS